MMTRSQSRAGAGAQALMMTRSQSRAQARIPSPTRFMTRGEDQGQDDADADRIPHLDFDAASRAWRANKRALRNGCFEYVVEPAEEEGQAPSTRKSGRNRAHGPHGSRGSRRVPAGPERFGTWNYCTPMTD